ncbi:unnamed protein product [Adineta steineri]|uniref:MARVEL domain-containing protein n=1 Tax=Adineta steineri TaxID=433720 RepID=A0A814P3U6_9BILA|nr:unnamed protein product [Adineta steineri]CAF0852580.1 unnamed protein product [Adineta steineri]CAF1055051.1 unnamed protein product [Adineta steineri]CAF1090217.1 unnamed protein product [Adineta steineri]CAF1100159.1 unnamed protein product [Adineta steineri]
MVDKNFILSLLGCANLIELTLLIGGFIAICVASTSYTQIINSYPNLIQHNTTQTNNADLTIFYDIDVYTIKQAYQTIFILIFCLTLCSFVAHIIFSFRYRYSWHRLSIGVAFLCVIYAFALVGVSVLVACWEDKLRKRLTSTYLSNQVISTANNSIKPQTGSAAAAATFGFAACLIYLAEALIRFRRLADKIQT